ncbi:MAG: TetR/AcrR family transcriptional regulator [Alphaproteobacteria bacterium]|jgi:AcrR family transcriptional regulator
MTNLTKTRSTGRSSRPQPESSGGRAALMREDWLDAARRVLIDEGISAVKIDRLAKDSNVTRGGFYWRFKSHGELLNLLMQDWRQNNSRSTLAALNGPGTPVQRFRKLMAVWLDEIDYSPAYDIAMREWARTSPKVARLVREVDEERIQAFQRLFQDAGYDEAEANIRARVTYYHQVGYYAMGVKEARNSRLELADLYFRILTGFE